METRIQCRWGGLGPNLGINLWESLHIGLDADEMIIFPEMYAKYRDLFDKVVGRGYLIRSKEPGARMDWCWASSLDKISERMDIEILAEQLVVRTRLPWNETQYEFTVSLEELNQHRDEWRVLDTIIRARNLENGTIGVIDPTEFHKNRKSYEVVEARYLVCWDSTPHLEPLDIDPENVFLNLAE